MNIDISYPANASWVNNTNFKKQLEKDNIDSELFVKEVEKINKDIHPKSSYRGKILKVISSNPFQITLSTLILLDAVIVMGEIILEIQSEQRVAEAYGELVTGVEYFFAGLNLTRGADDIVFSPGIESIMEDSYFNVEHYLEDINKLPYTCVDLIYTKPIEKSPLVLTAQNLHLASMILHKISLTLLSLFIVVIIVKVSCEGKHFLNDKFEVVDTVVVFISFILDVVTIVLTIWDYSLIVLILLWRIIRVINSLLMHEKQRNNLRIELQKAARKLAEEKNEEFQIEFELQQKYMSSLESYIKELGGTQVKIDCCKPKPMLATLNHNKNALKSMAGLSTSFFGSLIPSPRPVPSESDMGENQGSTSAYSNYSGIISPNTLSAHINSNHDIKIYVHGPAADNNDDAKHKNSHLPFGYSNQGFEAFKVDVDTRSSENPTSTDNQQSISNGATESNLRPQL